MTVVRQCAMVLVALAATVAGRSALCQEGAPPPKQKGEIGAGAEGRPNMGQPGMQRPGGQRDPMVPDIPATHEEMQRHMEAMRAIITGQRELAQQIAAEVKPLRDKGAQPAEIEAAIKKFAPQAEAGAAKVAEEFATHYANLAKIFQDKRDDVVKQLTKSILMRMAMRQPGQGPGAGMEKGERPMPKEKGERPMPREKGDRPMPKEKGTAPENF